MGEAESIDFMGKITYNDNIYTSFEEYAERMEGGQDGGRRGEDRGAGMF